jgi:L-lactate dehydrogenase (cytochrome)
MADLKRYLAVSDFEHEARRRLPRCVFEYVRGGTEDEWSLNANRAALQEVGFRPRGLRDVSARSQTVELWGKQYASPLGVSPTGLAGIVRHDCDLLLARAVAQASLPFVISGASNVPMERLQKEVPGSWYQAYFPGNRSHMEGVLARLEAANIDVLVVTIDTCIGANRENNQRNNFTVPFRFSAPLFLDGLAHPRWLTTVFAKTLFKSGIPRFSNLGDKVGVRITHMDNQGFRAGRDTLSWDDMRWLRDRWNGKLVIKGVMHPEDAELSESIGADALIVSNHGGRQLDATIGTLDALPDIVAQVSPTFPVLVDGGFRRGSDVLKAVALGARMVFVGRATLYGAAVAGDAGVARVLAILQAEIDRNLALLGCDSIKTVTRDLLVPTRANRNR